MDIEFTTEDVHPRDRLAYWRDVAVRASVKHEFRTGLGRAFRGSVRSGHLGHVRVATFEVGSCEYERTSADVAGADSDDLLLIALLKHRALVRQDNRVAALAAGDMTLLDARRPFKGSLPQGSLSVVLKVPRQGIERRVGNVSEITARAIKGSEPVGGLAAGFIAMLPSRVPSMKGVIGSRVADQVLDLVATALANEVGRRETSLSSPRSFALLRLKSAIEQRLPEPDLRPANAAAAAGISIRYANELLLAEGTSLERFILARRLERCRSALEDPTQSGRSIGDIAFSLGFSDLSHFGRRFKAAFGSAPRDYRRAATSRVAAGMAHRGPTREAISF